MTTQIDAARKVGAQIVAYTDGYRNAFVLKHRFAHRDAPELTKTLRAVRERGTIDLRYWRAAGKWER